MRKWVATLAVALALSVPGFASAVSVLEAADDAITRGDYVSAVEYLRIAATAGNTIAAETLGDIFWYGESLYGPGIVQDRSEALMWYHRAAERGSRFAAHVLSQIADGEDQPPFVGRSLSDPRR